MLTKKDIKQSIPSLFGLKIRRFFSRYFSWISKPSQDHFDLHEMLAGFPDNKLKGSNIFNLIEFLRIKQSPSLYAKAISKIDEEQLQAYFFKMSGTLYDKSTEPEPTRARWHLSALHALCRQLNGVEQKMRSWLERISQNNIRHMFHNALFPAESKEPQSTMNTTYSFLTIPQQLVHRLRSKLSQTQNTVDKTVQEFFSTLPAGQPILLLQELFELAGTADGKDLNRVVSSILTGDIRLQGNLFQTNIYFQMVAAIAYRGEKFLMSLEEVNSAIDFLIKHKESSTHFPVNVRSKIWAALIDKLQYFISDLFNSLLDDKAKDHCKGFHSWNYFLTEKETCSCPRLSHLNASIDRIKTEGPADRWNPVVENLERLRELYRFKGADENVKIYEQERYAAKERASKTAAEKQNEEEAFYKVAREMGSVALQRIAEVFPNSDKKQAEVRKILRLNHIRIFDATDEKLQRVCIQNYKTYKTSTTQDGQEGCDSYEHDLRYKIAHA